jgi:Cof subfamily protein (haloacid dehalogenase superfamily)
LALDLDGTLLHPDDTVSPRNRAAVEAAAATGWHIVLATARWYQLAERTANQLGLVDPVIACSGAEVRRLHDGADLFDVRLPAGFTAALYRLCDDENGMAFVYQDRDVLLRSELAPALDAMPEVRRVGSLAADADPTPRCALLFGDELNAKVLASLVPEWGSEVKFLTSMTGTGHSILTLTSAQADKGLALRIACQELGISVSEVVAIGDSETDIEMFKVAGAGVAMGQASDVVKHAADWVTASCTDDGAGRAIEEILAGARDPTVS